MVHKYIAEKTKNYFNSMAGDYFLAYAPRDEIFLKLILPKYGQKNKSKIRALDFACGGGSLLLKMLKFGIKAKGIEKHDELYQLARKRLEENNFNTANIIQGSIKDLDKLPKNSFDFIVLMGIFQYLSPQQRNQLYAKIYRLLKPKGHMVATFQNALFDLFTFNKYTIDFFQEKIFKPLKLDKSMGQEIITDLKSLITHPDKPDYSPKIARDNIYVETTNPLTISEELANHRFILLQKYFYSFFPLPRLMESKYKKQFEKFKKQFEVTRSKEWYGHFMANAFVVDCIKKG